MNAATVTKVGSQPVPSGYVTAQAAAAATTPRGQTKTRSVVKSESTRLPRSAPTPA
jgi:hypothetical protein